MIVILLVVCTSCACIGWPSLLERLVRWSIIEETLCRCLIKTTLLTIILWLGHFKFLPLKWFILLLWNRKTRRSSTCLIIGRVKVAVNNFDAINISCNHSSSLRLLPWSDSICPTCISNRPFPNIYSLKLLGRLWIIIKTICLIITLGVTIHSQFGLWCFNQCFTLSISTQLL